MATTASSTLLGPLTAAWTQPPGCTVAVAACSNCDFAWQAQTCYSSDVVQDDPSCWPPRTAGVYTPPQPLLAWGLYSPGLVCPEGWSTACSYDGSRQTGDFDFIFTPGESETAVGCCPTGFACRNNPSQTCVAALTSTTVPTVTCDSGTSADFSYQKIPFAVQVSDTATIISTFNVFAPLLQLNYQSSDLPASSTISSSSTGGTTASRPSSTTTTTTTTTTSSTSQPTSQSQGLPVGAQAGIGAGVAGGVILLALTTFLVVRARGRRMTSGDQAVAMQESKPPGELREADHTAAYEMSADYPVEAGVQPGTYHSVVSGSEHTY